MNIQLCACCLLIAGLCTCNRLSKAQEPENNFGLTSLHLSRSGESVFDGEYKWMTGYSVMKAGEGRVKKFGMNKQKRCSLNLCCPVSLYCCSSMTCCKGKKRISQRPCFST